MCPGRSRSHRAGALRERRIYRKISGSSERTGDGERNTEVPEVSVPTGTEELLSETAIADKEKRNEKIREAILQHGYSNKTVAEHLGLH